MVPTVEVPAGKGQHRNQADARRSADEPTLKHIQVIVLLEKEIAEHWCSEEAEAQSRKGHQTGLHRADPPDAHEGRLE